MNFIRDSKMSMISLILIVCMFMIIILLIVDIATVNKNEERKTLIEEISKVYNQDEEDVNGSVSKTSSNGYLSESEVLNKMYPIGSIYISTNNQNPGEIIGGEWEAYAQGRTIVGVGKSDREFKESQTGGHSSYDMRALLGAVQSNTLTLGYPMSPKVPNYNYTYAVVTSSYKSNIAYSSVNHSTFVVTTTGGQYSALQPYITTYIWKRVA